MDYADRIEWDDIAFLQETPEETLPDQALANGGDLTGQKVGAVLGEMETETDTCRICRGEGSLEQPLFYPCKCSGSIRYVHQECLMEWLSHSQKKHCELCKTPFHFTKIYHQSMPSTLPLPLFLKQLLLHTLRSLIHWLRYVLVFSIWLCWLPWSIRQVWRGFFWLADASWVSEKDLRSGVLAILAQDYPGTEVRGANWTSDSLSPSQTTNEALSTSTPGGNATIFSLLPTPQDHSIARLVGLMHSRISHLILAFTASNVTETPDLSPLSDRQPSLLSDVAFLNSISSHALYNNILVDIFEGQLICLLIVAAFILIFLIREWVINQQPAPDVPDQDGFDAVPVYHAPPAEERPPTDSGQDHVNEAEGTDQNTSLTDASLFAPPPATRTRRAKSSDDLTGLSHVADAAEADSSRTRSLGLFPTSQLHVDRPVTSENRQEARPVSLARNALDDAAHIHRGLEEKQRAEPQQMTMSQTLSLPFGLNDAPNEDEGTSQEINRRTLPPQVSASTSLYQEPESRQILGDGERLERTTNCDDSTKGPIDGQFEAGKLVGEKLGSEPLFIQPAVYDRDRRNSQYLPAPIPPVPWALITPTADTKASLAPEPNFDENTQDNGSSYAQTLSDQGRNATRNQEMRRGLHVLDGPADSEIVAPLRQSDTQSGPSSPDTFIDEDQQDSLAAIRPVDAEARQSTLDWLFDWFWHTDDQLAPEPEDADMDDERVVQDIDAETPFVPVHNGGRGGVLLPTGAGDPLFEPPPDPVRAAADLDLQLDNNQNDADGIDDVEDLDGILDLLGFRGPLAGMVQNVIFSEVLITLTIGVSVWMPYIWGKIALLFLANPVSLLIRVPFFLLSQVADILVDIFVVLTSTTFSLLTYLAVFAIRLLKPLLPSLEGIFDLDHSRIVPLPFVSSSRERLSKVLSVTINNVQPSMPTVSMQSHHALRVFETWVTITFTTAQTAIVTQSRHFFELLHQRIYSLRQTTISVSSPRELLHTLPSELIGGLSQALENLRIFKSNLPSLTFSAEAARDFSLLTWSTREKIIAILLGYLFFGLLGYLYLRFGGSLFGKKPDEKVDGVVADSLRQAGGVVKVVVIIGIEMIVFPLYCGLLLDVALLPLFAEATIGSRAQFVLHNPITALFVHWFIGTCYMFHFALFVSMCRKMMRKGVLYFIRDPDDPTFHPVRDVLERPVGTQLSKIAYSALVYGGLVILCMGGVVSAIGQIRNVFPIHWATSEPRLALPVDLIVCNFMMPYVIKNLRLSRRVSTSYEWWFRACARELRLTHFLFGEERDDEKYSDRHLRWASAVGAVEGNIHIPLLGEEPRSAEHSLLSLNYLRDGTYVRAPASDSVRIPKGARVFVEVNEQNERIDGQDDNETGLHGKKDERFARIYIPPHFQFRISAFIFLLWAFSSVGGLCCTILPLLLGRTMIYWITQSNRPPNDLYAFSIGLHVLVAGAGAVLYGPRAARWLSWKSRRYVTTIRQALNQGFHSLRDVAALLYLVVAFGAVLPIAISLFMELSFHAPLFTYFARHTTPGNGPGPQTQHARVPPIFIVQTWTLGMLYFRLLLRIAMNYRDGQTRIAAALRAIGRDGLWRPDIGLATRAVVLPLSLLLGAALTLPLIPGKLIITIWNIEDPVTKANIYRYSYPGSLAAALVGHSLILVKCQVDEWRTAIRDEMYLIGERLHNFHDSKRSNGASSTAAASPARKQLNKDGTNQTEHRTAGEAREGEKQRVEAGTQTDPEIHSEAVRAESSRMASAAAAGRHADSSSI